MPSRRSRREKNRAKKIAKLNDDSCATIASRKILNVRSVTVFKKRVKKRILSKGTAIKPILKVRRIA